MSRNPIFRTEMCQHLPVYDMPVTWAGRCCFWAWKQFNPGTSLFQRSWRNVWLRFTWVLRWMSQHSTLAPPTCFHILPVAILHPSAVPVGCLIWLSGGLKHLVSWVISPVWEFSAMAGDSVVAVLAVGSPPQSQWSHVSPVHPPWYLIGSKQFMYLFLVVFFSITCSGEPRLTGTLLEAIADRFLIHESIPSKL